MVILYGGVQSRLSVFRHVRRAKPFSQACAVESALAFLCLLLLLEGKRGDERKDASFTITIPVQPLLFYHKHFTHHQVLNLFSRVCLTTLRSGRLSILTSPPAC